ncbi:putative pectinesterase 15 [Cocos nucifera]|uniref:Putative pectinesterase 15 n=1 Tax=Cocos nucifera TaxID=13894 RepID=A0A8K0IJA8_COCNU|nr:putative pectinesterase 15 [Cocos nucifera]
MINPRVHSNSGRPTPHSSVGHNRKADLLRYAQHLRALAHGATTPGCRITYSNTPEKQSSKLVPVSRKHKYRRTPTCFGDWKKILLPCFVPRSLASFQEKKKRRKKGSESASSKMSTMVKSLTAQKQGLVKKLLSAFARQK